MGDKMNKIQLSKKLNYIINQFIYIFIYIIIMEQINCPVCTFLNLNTNTNCDCCDSILIEGTEINNPLEDEFMQLTGDTRSIAQEYLQVSENSIDKAIGLYYEDKEIGITNADYVNQQNEIMNVFRQLINTSIRRIYEKPKNIKDLVCQLLYRRGGNTPHYCVLCDSKAYLLCSKIISYKDSISDIIRLIHQNDMNELNIGSDKHGDLVKEIIKNINDDFLPKILANLEKYIKEAYYNRDELLKEHDVEWIDNYMNQRNGMDFRIIWDTIHQGNDSKLEEDKINDILKNLLESTEFHSYLNQSWENPIYNHPATQETLSELKKIKLTEDCEHFEKLKNDTCAICMDEFVTDGREVIMLKCHSFCSKCILEWLENHNDTCPVCRKTVGEPVKKIESIN